MTSRREELGGVESVDAAEHGDEVRDADGDVLAQAARRSAPACRRVRSSDRRRRGRARRASPGAPAGAASSGSISTLPNQLFSIAAGSRPTAAAVRLEHGELVAELVDAAAEVPAVGVAGDEAQQHLLAAAADHDRRIRLLHRLRIAPGVAHPVVPAREGRPLLGPHAPADLQRLVELRAGACRWAGSRSRRRDTPARTSRRRGRTPAGRR